MHVVGRGGVGQFGQNVVFLRRGPQWRHFTVEVFAVHGQDAAEQVAQVVGQIGVDAGGHGLVREGGVGSEVHFPQQEVPEGVQAEMSGRLSGVHHVAQGFGHFGVAHQPVAVHVEMFVHRQVGRFEDGGPEYAVGLEDVLGHQVFARPETGVVAVRVALVVRPAQGGNIVGQGVEPHVAHIVAVEGQFHAPGQTGLGSRDAQILQHPAVQHGQHLVAVALGPDEVGMVQDVLFQPALIFGHFEKVIFSLMYSGLV